MSKNFSFYFMLKLWIISLLISLEYNKVLSLEVIQLSPTYDIEGLILSDIKDYDDAAYIVTIDELVRASTNTDGLDEPEWYDDFVTPEPDYNPILFQKNTVFASYGESFIFAGCDRNYLISYFSSMSGVGGIVHGLYKDNSINLNENAICSISYLNYFIFLVHTYNNKLYFHRIKIDEQISHETINRDPDYERSKYYFIFTPYFDIIPNFRYFSCETISQEEGDIVLVCGFVYKDTEINKYKYVSSAANKDFNGLGEETLILESENLLFFKIQKIDTHLVRYLVENNSFEIFVTKNNDNRNYRVHVVSEELRNENLNSFNSYGDLFYYNNDYIFHAIPTDDTPPLFQLLITNDKGRNIPLITVDKEIQKIQGFYDKITDKFLYVFQSNDGIYYLIDSSSNYASECEKAW